MKTPRELLLARHRAAEPKLDAIRKRAVATLDPRPSAFDSWLAVCWQELFWPCRRAWAGLAAVWAVILALNFSAAEHMAQPTVAAVTQLPGSLESWKQRQEQLLAELSGQQSEPAEPPKPSLPRPHSERRSELLIG